MAGEGRPSTSSLYAGGEDVDGGTKPRHDEDQRHERSMSRNLQGDPVDGAIGGPVREPLR
jgi:hypothetical protein